MLPEPAGRRCPGCGGFQCVDRGPADLWRQYKTDAQFSVGWVALAWEVEPPYGWLRDQLFP